MKSLNTSVTKSSYILVFLIYFTICLVKTYSASPIILSSTIKSFKHLYTKLRSKETSPEEFREYSRRIIRIIIEEGISCMEPELCEVQTPTGAIFSGEKINLSKTVVVSIIRAGDSMLEVFNEIVPNAIMGKILIQRDEETAKPHFYYSKLPNLKNCKVALVDPMLGTGGSAICAINALIEKGANPKDIYFFNVLACPEGIQALQDAFPGNIYKDALQI
jgi:uracil phosphoribosyltransferase